MGKRKQQVERQRFNRAQVELFLPDKHPEMNDLTNELRTIVKRQANLRTPYDARLHAAIVTALDAAIDNAPPSMLESGALVVDLEVWATAVIDELAEWWPSP